MRLLIILGVFIGYAYGQFAYNPYTYHDYFSPRYFNNYYPTPYDNYYNGFQSNYNPSYNYYGSRLAQASQVYPQYAKSVPKYTPVYPQYSHVYPKYASAHTNENNARILKFDSEVHPGGGYHYNYETENGITAHEVGGAKTLGGPNVAQGSFGWVSPEGKVVSVSYIADEFGYRPVNNNVDSSPVAIQAARAVTEKPKTS